MTSPQHSELLQKAALETVRRIQASPYIPQSPTPKQLAFLLAPEREVLFGGSAGPGKSSALLMAALQYADVPGYSALLLRRTYADLSLPGALMDRADTWLRGTDARWLGLEKTWRFPSGATLTFGYLQTAADRYRYQGSELDFCGFDELTQFGETEYRYLMSRLRRGVGSKVPSRMRAATNPGGTGHDWVRQRFLTERSPERRFIPALLHENPHLDQDAYQLSLAELDPVTRAQLLRGDWEVRASGGWFARQHFVVVDEVPQLVGRVRFWDMAASEVKDGKDPDWTAGVLIGKGVDDKYYVLDVQRFREGPAVAESLVSAAANVDGRGVEIRMEQEPGSSGVTVIDHYKNKVLDGYAFQGLRSTGKKTERARPWAAAVANGRVRLKRGAWNREFVEEHAPFPLDGAHDDQVDAASGAYGALSDPKNAEGWIRYMKQRVDAFQAGRILTDTAPPEKAEVEENPWAGMLRRQP